MGEVVTDVANRLGKYQTALYYAAKGGHSELCVKLLEMGADVNAVDEVCTAGVEGMCNVCAFVLDEHGICLFVCLIVL